MSLFTTGQPCTSVVRVFTPVKLQKKHLLYIPWSSDCPDAGQVRLEKLAATLTDTNVELPFACCLAAVGPFSFSMKTDSDSVLM